MTTSPEILVAGGGPIGLTAAVELSRRGFAPVVVDNDSGPSPESRALAIHARTLDILEASGVTEQLLASGNRIHGMIFREGVREFMRLDARLLPHRFNFILALPQSETERILAERLEEFGQPVNWNTEVTGIASADQGFEITLKTGKGQTSRNADILIGADGAHSLVRKSLNLNFDGETEPREFGLADVTLDDWPLPFDQAVVSYSDAGVCGFFPFAEGRGRFVATHPDVLNHLPSDAKLRDIVWQSKFRVSYRQVSSYQKGNAYLAGDAAHIHSPVGGRGMNLGIEDAATLAWLIARGDTSDYTRLRHEAGARVLKFTEQQTRQLRMRGPVARFMRMRIAPLFMQSSFFQKLGLKRLTGLDGPPSPWLASQ